MEQLANIATDKKIFNFVYSLTHDKFCAEDLLQNAFLQASQKLHQFKAGTNLRAWFTMIIKRMFINEYLKRKRGLPVISTSLSHSAGEVYEGVEKFDYFMQIKDVVDHVAEIINKEYFDDYLKAVAWAQLFASLNRDAMMENVVTALQSITQKTVRQPQTLAMEEINCHHNYVQKEQHFGEEIYVTRKGAVSARAGQYGIIPGSMGAKSFIVRGLGNEESFCSCSHGAGRVMSRTKAKKLFSVEDQIRATAHVECRKDAEVIDEIPMAYKDIDAVMAAQSDLVEVIYTLRQVVCVKG